MNVKSAAALSLLVVALVACGRAAPETPTAQTSTPSPESPVRESPLSPPPTPVPQEGTSPLPDPSTSPIEPPSEPSDDVVQAAKEHLAEEPGVAPGEIDVTAIEPVVWPDASLGCPEPGKSYAQVVTPGYRFVLEAGGKEYELHADEDGGTVVMCERALEEGPAAAVELIAARLDISPEEVEVMSVQAYEWPDTSLGCPEPGMTYAQVITPGYRVILRAEGDTFEVHTDEEGRIVVLCEPDR